MPGVGIWEGVGVRGSGLGSTGDTVSRSVNEIALNKEATKMSYSIWGSYYFRFRRCVMYSTTPFAQIKKREPFKNPAGR